MQQCPPRGSPLKLLSLVSVFLIHSSRQKEPNLFSVCCCTVKKREIGNTESCFIMVDLVDISVQSICDIVDVGGRRDNLHRLSI